MGAGRGGCAGRRATVAVALLVAAVVSACTLAPTAQPSATSLAAVGTVTGSASVPPEAAALVEQARQQLATRASVAADLVQIVSVTRVDWPTSALGCPQQGRAYAQVITPGYRILLATGGQTYEFHSDLGQRVLFCANPSA